MLVSIVLSFIFQLEFIILSLIFHAQFYHIVGLFGTSGAYVVLWDLTYNSLSWDIMEPVTYFLATGIGMGSMLWWLLTNIEYEYTNVIDLLQKRLFRRKLNAAGLSDMEHHREITEKMNALKAEIVELDKREGQMI